MASGSGKAYVRKIKQKEKWTCPVCGHVNSKDPICPECKAELIRFVAPEPDEKREGPLLRLHGRVREFFAAVGTGPKPPAGPQPEGWLTSFDLEMENGTVIAVACRQKTWMRFDHEQGHWMAALRPGAEAEVLARVEPLSPGLHGEPPPASNARLGARAQVVAVGPKAEDLLRRAARELGIRGAAALGGQDKEIPDGITVDQLTGPAGSRELVVTMISNTSGLFSPRIGGPGVCLFLLLQILGVGGLGNWPWALPVIALAVPLTWFWLAGLNRRVIRLGSGTLSLSFTPIRWPGWVWPVDQVKGLVSLDNNSYRTSISSYHPDTLMAVRADGKQRALLRGASDNQVYFVLYFVKTALDLDDENINMCGS